MRRDGLYNWCKQCDIWKRQERRKRKRDEAYTMAGGLMEASTSLITLVLDTVWEYRPSAIRTMNAALRPHPQSQKQASDSLAQDEVLSLKLSWAHDIVCCLQQPHVFVKRDFRFSAIAKLRWACHGALS